MTMMMMMQQRMSYQSRALLLLVVALALGLADSATGTFEAGTATTKVVALNKSNFKSAIEDPANSFWLLKFFAPWCGHCKKLAPVLESVAPKLAGKMAIGTIDCTQEKKLCDEYKVRGYPTLKFTLDGEMYDYPGGRSEKDFLEFSAKMLRPIVETVRSVDEAKTYATEKAEEGVAFLAYDPAVVVTEGKSVEEQLQSTTLTQVYAQVARKLRALGHFLLLDTSATTDDESAAALAAEIGTEGAFICRLETNVAPRCFSGSKDDDTTNLNLPKVLQWVEAQNVATVTKLGSQNFHKIGRAGRPLVIAVVSEQKGDGEDLETAKRELARYALSGPESIREKYYYGWLDGVVWKRFLEQFNIVPEELPQIFVLDVPAKTYWRNATYLLNVDDLLQAIEDGTVPSQTSGKKGLENFLTKFYNFMIIYRPWSVMVAVLLFVALVVSIVSCISPGEDLRPPYPRQPEPTAAASTKASESDDKSKTPTKVKFEGDAKKDSATTSDEPKKDK